MNTAPLAAAIKAYKYPPHKWGWSMIFGRVLLGWLHENIGLFGLFDAIIPMPTYVGDRPYDHIGKMVGYAADQDDRGLPFIINPPLIRKTAETTRLARTASLSERRAVGREEIYPVLVVDDPARVAGKAILVIDDIFTDGTTLDTVARRLRESGAELVCGLALARQPWGLMR